MKKVLSLSLLLLNIQLFAQQYIVENLTPLDQFHEAIDIAHAPDGRILIAERAGAINVYQDGVTTEILTVSTNTDSEQGLLGIALHPDFTTEGWIYYFYTNAGLTLHHIDRAWLDAENTISQATNLLTLDPIIGGFHNGGSLVFHNGFLFVSSGDSQQPAQSQDLTTYRGKILRLTDAGQPAPSNPYADAESIQQRSIWAVGFRNPWRMYSDAETGRLFVVDVGTSWEEINEITQPDADKQYNYGWGHNQGGDGIKNNNLVIDPIYAYATGSAEGCAITNGVYFNPSQTNYPDSLMGHFIFSDWCRDELRVVNVDQAGLPSGLMFKGLPGRPLGLSIGLDGNFYFADYNGNSPLSRLIYENDQVPQIVNHPQSLTAMETMSATFEVTASGAIPLSFQWQKDGQDLAGEQSAALNLQNLAFDDAGMYRVIVTNANGADTSDQAELNIIEFNAAPEVTITEPLPTLTFDGGDFINYSGYATDDEDGPLDAASMSWELQLWHQDTEESGHWHPGPGLPSGETTGEFEADNQGEKSPNIWFMLIAKAIDNNGNEGRDSVEVYPNLVEITGQTEPAGLELLVSVKQQPSPVSTYAVVNTKGLLNAPQSQILNNVLYEFSHWEHGGGASQEFTVPANDTTFIAVYEEVAITQQPYGDQPVEIPGRIEAEEYDQDGAGIAYNDLSAGNAGGQLRADDVDVEGASEGGYNVGWIQAGEWLEYTAQVLTSGFYQVTFRVTSPNDNRTFHLEIDEEDVTGELTIPNSGGFQNWQDVVVEDIPIVAGIHELRFVAGGADFNFNYMDFDLTATGPQADFLVNQTDICLGDTIEVQQDASGQPDTFTWSFGPGATPQTAVGPGPHHVVYILPGQHSITLEVSEEGLPSTLTKESLITVASAPEPQWIQAPLAVECFTPNIYFADGQSGSNYEWNWAEIAEFYETDDHGTNHEHIALIFNEAGPTTVSVVEIDINGCRSDTLTAQVEVDCMTTGVGNVQKAGGLWVHPNPVAGVLHIHGISQAPWILFNAAGQQVKTGTESSIDVTPLEAGLYLLQVGQQKLSVVVER